MLKKLKNTRRFNIFLALIILVTLICNVSCSNASSVSTPGTDDFGVFPSELKGMISNKKVYFTSIGQSIEYDEFIYYVEEMDLLEGFIAESLLNPNKVDAGSVVFVCVGCSIKGIGSTTTFEEEKVRSTRFSYLSKNGKITMIGVHVGGEQRRGSTSDTMIETIFSSSTLNLFTRDGNTDGFLSSTSLQNEIPCYAMNSYEDTFKFLLGEDL